MADLFENYVLGTAWDEMFAEADVTRPPYAAIHAALQPLASADLRVRAEGLAKAFLDRGVTFALAGVERPFPMDLVPRVVNAEDWQIVERGVTQRVKALEAFLADVYGPGRAFADRIVPRRLVTTSKHFHREAVGVEPPTGARVMVAGVDLIRDEAGKFCVLEDNVRVPSGVSYVMENRQAMSYVLPEAFATHRIRPVADYPAKLLAALKKVAPRGVADPTVVVLTPGIYNSAYFEHALLAREMGVELVEGRDLVCSGNRVGMRTTAGEEPVHVIYRRVDDRFLDPLQFRPDSALGCAGLLNAARAGSVTIANAIGNGVADDKLVYTYVPDLIRYYLGEEPVLDNIETYRLENAEELEYVLGQLEYLVLKPVDGAGGAGIVIGSQATDEELSVLRAKVEADPRSWIAQREVALSTVPTLIDDRLQPRHVDLRPFAVHDGEKVWVLPGGLTRVALPEGTLVVNSSQGGGSKDTWVLADESSPLNGREAVPEHTRIAAGVPEVGRASAPDPGPELEDQQQQQQQ